MPRRLLPEQWREHPWFLTDISYLGLALVLHLGSGLRQMLQPQKFDNSAYEVLYDHIGPWGWGLASIIVAVALIYGLYRSYAVMVAGLAAGFFLCLLRGMLIELGDGGTGAGIFVWVPLALGHWSQLMVQTAGRDS